MCLSHWLEPSGTRAVSEATDDAAWAAPDEVGRRAIAPREATAARAFYCDALRGRQVWPTEDVVGGGSLWFLVGLTLVEAGPDVRLTATPIALEVDDPTDMAERCWDAGFSVSVWRDAADRTALSVIDPFGRRVDLAARESAMSPLAATAEERR